LNTAEKHTSGENLTTEELMAYNASIQAKWDWENAVAYAVDAAVEKALEKERAKNEEERVEAAKLLEKEREKTEAERAEKLDAVRTIKEMAMLTNEQIAEKFNLPLTIVEGL